VGGESFQRKKDQGKKRRKKEGFLVVKKNSGEINVNGTHCSFHSSN
jgi:hypothetical protein